MNKLAKIGAIAAISVLPFMALANNDHGLHLGQIKHQKREISGTVTTVGATSFNLTVKNGTVYTVNTASSTITSPFLGTITLAGVHVNDKAFVKGEVSGTTINAKTVVITPVNTHPASGKGTVSATGTNTFTLKMNHEGIVSFATVNTNANTEIRKNGATTTSASITVDSKVEVKGLWDETLNVLNATKVKIK